MEKKFKSNKLKVKDVDQKKGIVSAYYSNYGTLDSDHEIIEQGSATKTAQERGPEGSNRIKHFKNHSRWEVPGALTELGEDEIGGWFVSQLAKMGDEFSTTAKDVLIEYHAGIITEHSHGFETIKSTRDEAGVNHIQEIRLWEVSSLTAWGANSNTPLRSLKDLNDPYEILKALDNVNEYLKIGEFSDQLLEDMERRFKTLNEHYKNITNSLDEKSRKALLDDKPDISKLLHNLKISY